MGIDLAPPWSGFMAIDQAARNAINQLGRQQAGGTPDEVVRQCIEEFRLSL